MVGTGADGRDDLVRLRGGEDKDEVLWWFLHDLQQGVEAFVGDHVRLVDDEDAVAGIRRSVKRPVAQVTHVVDAAVAGGVQFGDVQVAGAARGERHAGGAFSAGG